MVVYKAKKYYLHKSGYWTREKVLENGKRRCVLLHRVVWEDHNGPIPPKYHIHHKDGDRGNWDIANLECVSQSEHTRYHRKKEVAEGGLQSFREKAKWLCTTAQGKALRRAGYLRWRREKPLEIGHCTHCGEVMEIIMRVKKFCSQGCWKKYHYLQKKCLSKK